MAYSRYRRKPRRNYRKPVRNVRKAYTKLNRKYRPTRRRAMSKKRILNTSSRKKRNGMLSWSNTTSAGAVRAAAPGPAYINGVTGGFFTWHATAQQLDAQSTIANQATRTSTTCYMKGLSEHLRIQTSSGLPWFHRRVCFTLKGINAFNAPVAGDTPAFPIQTYIDTSNGIERLWSNEQINVQPNTLNAQWSVLFKGIVGKDWDDYIIAPLDTSRVTIKFDKTWTMQSGNTQGIVRERKLWHPMNHNLVYDDDENGDIEASSYFSTTSKAGMGDYYVIDMFQPGAGGTSTDLLQIAANSTLYWHEK